MCITFTSLTRVRNNNVYISTLNTARQAKVLNSSENYQFVISSVIFWSVCVDSETRDNNS